MTLSLNADERDLNLSALFPPGLRDKVLFDSTFIYSKPDPDGKGRVATAAVIRFSIDHNRAATQHYQSIPFGELLVKLGATPEETCVLGAMNFAVSSPELIRRSGEALSPVNSRVSNWHVLTSRQRQVVEEGIRVGRQRTEDLVAKMDRGQLTCANADPASIRSDLGLSPFEVQSPSFNAKTAPVPPDIFSQRTASSRSIPRCNGKETSLFRLNAGST